MSEQRRKVIPIENIVLPVIVYNTLSSFYYFLACIQFITMFYYTNTFAFPKRKKTLIRLECKLFYILRIRTETKR